MGKEGEALVGFSWKRGATPETQGILLWQDVFLHSTEQIAIVVVDTQGLFDGKTSSNGHAKISALSSLISSVMILNLKEYIPEDRLQYLDFATTFAKISEGEVAAFQKLLFLIRDWKHNKQFAWGLEGGSRYLNEEVFGKAKERSQDLQDTRESIKASFERIECCLLPFPGDKVDPRDDEEPESNGQVGDLILKFKDNLKIIIEDIFGSDGLVKKSINGNEVTAGNLLDFVKDYAKVLNSATNLPDSLKNAMIERTMRTVLEDYVEFYKNEFKAQEEKTRDKFMTITEEDLLNLHDNAKNKFLADLESHKLEGLTNEKRQMFKNEYADKIDGIYSKVKPGIWKRIIEMRAKVEEERRSEELEPCFIL